MFDGLFEPTHLLIILAICVLIFGPSKLPQLGKGLGESIREFKNAISKTSTAPPEGTAAGVEQKK
ncbi:MAG: twin-arginine translocase TatA/TatE family subunit [Terriglobales bacterium]